MVVFTHANFIRALLQYYLQSNPKHAWLIGQNNTAITEILFNEQGISLVKVNDSGHLLFLMPRMISQIEKNTFRWRQLRLCSQSDRFQMNKNKIKN